MSFDPASKSSLASAPSTTREYLARVEERLQVLTQAERREILDEMRSHIAERYAGLDESDSAAALIADFGTPDACADAFLAEYGVSPAQAAPERRGQSLAWRMAAGAALGLLALALVMFALLNVSTPPAAESNWFTWRDVGLGRYGWVLLFAASLLLAGAAAVAAVRLVRRR